MADKNLNSITFPGLPDKYKVAQVADEYSSSSTYAVGDIVNYLGTIYRCTTAISTAEAWTAGHWTEVKIANEVTDLKSAVGDIYYISPNLHNKETDRHGTNIDGSGTITSNSLYKATDYIYVGAGNKVTIQSYNESQRVLFYETNSADGFSRALWFTDTNPKTVTLSSTEEYIVITLLETAPDFMANLGETLLPYVPYGGVPGPFLQEIIEDIDDQIAEIVEDSETSTTSTFSSSKITNLLANVITEDEVKIEIINRFDKTTISEGKYINPNDGSLSNNNDFFASDYIYIGDLDSVTVSYTHLFCWYDENKDHLTPNPSSMNSGTNDLTFTRPENAIYLRFSAYDSSLNTAQIGEGVSRYEYVPYGIYKLPKLRVSESQVDVSDDSKIVVDSSGNGDYTSFTEAIYDTVDSGVDVFVKAGTYDIIAEYVALFGQSAVDNMADADSSTFNGFQYGVRIRKRKVEFAPGSHLVCDWTGHTVDGTHRFSALGVDYNCEIVGLDLDCTGTFYCIHDDYGPWDIPYTVIYKNCRIIGHNVTNANCIGGGCKKYSRHILKNCYFDNNLTGSATVRYHNTNDEGAEPEIYVSNCYFNNWFTPRWYGTQTSKMKVYVNNCEARSIHKLAESSSFNVDNVELYKWCNTETNPVT